jgi:biotin transport system permease protein
MMREVATYVRQRDPRLKLCVAFLLGPSLWGLGLPLVGACLVCLSGLVLSLAVSQPLGVRMVRSLFFFVLFWVAVKAGLDAVSGLSAAQVGAGAADLALRLAALLLLGLFLALSSSARALGLAVSWAVRPLVGREQAWRLALSLSLMIHFLPMCLDAIAQVRQTLSRRCPRCGFFLRMVVIPQAVIRSLGQKTWNQTLAVAGRGLDNPRAWKPDFSWTSHDSAWALVFLCGAAWLCIIRYSPFF